MSRRHAHPPVTPFEQEDAEAQKPKITPAAVMAAARGDLSNAAVALKPGGIEAQEKAGQIEQSLQDTLPIDMHGCSQADFEKLGFKFLNKIDRLFWQCEFPKGWRKKPTDHSMWSDLLDDKGRKRAGIFFKAAFYDRDAFIGLTPRYGVKSAYLDANKEEIYDRLTGNYKPGKQDSKSQFTLIEVVDNATGQALFGGAVIACPDWGKREEAMKLSGQKDECFRQYEGWLDNHYPRWKEASAYWD